MKDHFYITTAIDYPNAAPHLGHAYEKIIADAYARWYAMLGADVHFLTGTDENGQKLEKAAKEQGMDTQLFVDQNSQKFRELCVDLGLSHDDFVRTTESRHIQVVQDFWRKMLAKGDIYFGTYKGHYCLACEAFYAEAQAPDLKCPVHEKPLTQVAEDGYFFRLSKYHEAVLKHLKGHSDFLFPRSARSEMLSRLESEPLLDLSISRPNGGWGIPVPDHSEYVIYTWFDALISYVSGTYADDNGKPLVDRGWWPAAMHVIGKDISWFHAVIWPAMLMSAEYPLPKQIYVHGMILGADGRRMSKSAGNGVDPQECLAAYPLDSFRFYLLKCFSSGQDGAFALKDLEKTHNNELANELGNLLLRTVKMSLKYFGEDLKPTDDVDFKLDLFEPVKQAMDQREHHRALGLLWEGVRKLNAYLNEKEPWRIKNDPTTVHRILYTTLANLFPIVYLLRPFVPTSATKALSYFGIDGVIDLSKDLFCMEFHLKDQGPLFPRFEPTLSTKA